MSTANYPEVEKLAESLHSAAIRLLRSVQRVDERSGLTAARLSALSVIVFRGPITLGELADAEQVRPPTMTRIVNALEEEQFVVKAQDPSDRRLIAIAATMKGKRVLIRARAQRAQLLAEKIQFLSKAEREGLASSLVALQKLMDQDI